MIDYQYFQKSLNHLQAQFLNYQSLDLELPKLMQEAVADFVRLGSNPGAVSRKHSAGAYGFSEFTFVIASPLRFIIQFLPINCPRDSWNPSTSTTMPPPASTTPF